jgi:hypothetical protein
MVGMAALDAFTFLSTFVYYSLASVATGGGYYQHLCKQWLDDSR